MLQLLPRMDLGVNLDPGTIFAGDFRILAPLGRGGMGVVFRAEQLSTGRQRALKVLGLARATPEQLRRFEQESRVGARIQSPHVVEVVAAGCDRASGIPWLAMELLEGCDLASALRGPVPFDRRTADSVLLQLLDALAAAHAASVIHRDLKPENLFLVSPPHPGALPLLKVLDFGIAKILGDTSSHTSPLGTPRWMAPEQTSPLTSIRPAADVWAIGLIAFSLYTGGSYWRSTLDPFATPAQFMRELLIDPLPPASVRAALLGASDRLPRGFDAWFARCVAREPEGRFPSADAARAAFRPLLDAGPATHRDAPPTASTPTASTPPDPTRRGTLSPLASSGLSFQDPTPRELPGMTSRSPSGLPSISGSSGQFTPTTAQTPTAHSLPGYQHAATLVSPVVSPLAQPTPAGLPPAPAPPPPPPPGALPWISRSGALALLTAASVVAIGFLAMTLVVPRLGAPQGGLAPGRGLPTSPTTPPPSPAAVASLMPVPQVSWLRYSPRTNAIMALFTEATLWVGSDDVEQERPRHQVTVRAFALDTKEVSVALYRACADAGGCPAPISWEITCNWGKPDRLNHPMNCVERSHASAYCAWVGGQRLPTEFELEYAARGVEGRTYPWGNAPPDPALCWNRAGASAGTCSTLATTPDVTRQLIEGLVSNVSEWTSSPFCSYRSPGCAGAPPLAAVRGGHSGQTTPLVLRGAYRQGIDPAARSPSVGFRCALSL